EIDTDSVIEGAAQLRVCRAESFDDAFARLFEQVVQAPSIGRLKDPNRMAQTQQLGGDPSQAVRAWVVPIGKEGMVEEDEAHDALSPAPACCRTRIRCR